jgi:hypothetical protein
MTSYPKITQRHKNPATAKENPSAQTQNQEQNSSP